MTQRNLEIATADGKCPCSLHIPDVNGPRPAVIMYPDAGGLRDTFREMGERLATKGYVTLVPDFYYRSGDYEPFDLGTAFSDPTERDRLMKLMGSVTPEMVVSDARSYVDYLTSLPETTGSAVGTTGYCMGGRLSLIVVGHLGDRVAAAASFHGGNLAAADDPTSPHLLAGSMRATVYVGGASDDASFPPEQRDRLDQALEEAGVRHTIETYPASHGFAVPDNPTYHAAAAERHWEAMTDLFRSSLGSDGTGTGSS
ncbi:MAG: dienelactone hydrolase family protein [Acidimicrobiales bacterium]